VHKASRSRGGCDASSAKRRGNFTRLVNLLKRKPDAFRTEGIVTHFGGLKAHDASLRAGRAGCGAAEARRAVSERSVAQLTITPAIAREAGMEGRAWMGNC